MHITLLKSILHNIGVVIVGLVFALIGRAIDSLLGLGGFNSPLTIVLAWILLIAGFLLRVWATLYFYEHQMKVISLQTQKELVTSGPFSFSRNPLYLGGNVFIFLGWALLLGSPAAILLTILNILLLNFWMIPKEEKQLERTFGEKWIHYRKRVRRWL